MLSVRDFVSIVVSMVAFGQSIEARSEGLSTSTQRARFLNVCQSYNNAKNFNPNQALDLFRSKLPELTKTIQDIQAVVDYQRLDAASRWLEDNKIEPADCKAWLRLFEPKEIAVELNSGEHLYRISWQPISALCFKRLKISVHYLGQTVDTAVPLQTEYCVQADLAGRPNFVLQDVNFDGIQDVRGFAPLTINQSQQFSIVFLGTRSKTFVRSLELERLISFEVDPKEKLLRSLLVKGNEATKTVSWKWHNGKLRRVSSD
jgi:hypothetical protein